jgi:drug/metabolite transporter (DMT)-like permease
MSSSFLTGNAWLAGSIVLASLGQVLLRAAVRHGQSPPAPFVIGNGSPWARNVMLAAAAIGIVGGFLAWTACLRHLAVSYAYTVACSSVVLVSLLGCLFLRERWSPAMTAGTALILCGTLLLFADGLRSAPIEEPPSQATEATP